MAMAEAHAENQERKCIDCMMINDEADQISGNVV